MYEAEPLKGTKKLNREIISVTKQKIKAIQLNNIKLWADPDVKKKENTYQGVETLCGSQNTFY